MLIAKVGAGLLHLVGRVAAPGWSVLKCGSAGSEGVQDPKLKNRRHLFFALDCTGERWALQPLLRCCPLAQVDADAHRSLGEKFGVRGFPTIKWFPRGKAAAPEE